jgi:hypothetical protein
MNMQYLFIIPLKSKEAKIQIQEATNSSKTFIRSCITYALFIDISKQPISTSLESPFKGANEIF